MAEKKNLKWTLWIQTKANLNAEELCVSSCLWYFVQYNVTDNIAVAHFTEKVCVTSNVTAYTAC